MLAVHGATGTSFVYIQLLCCPLLASFLLLIRLLYRLDPLHDHGGSGTSAVADGRHAVLARLQLMQQSDEDSRTRAAKRVPQRDGASHWVHIRPFQPEDLRDLSALG